MPAGVKATVGRPAEVAPFLQVRLPDSAKYQGKNGRSWSFVPQGSAPMPRGTSRKYSEACNSAVQWANAWFSSLTVERQNALRERFGEQPIPPENPRPQGAPEDPAVEVPARPAKRARGA